MIKRSDIEENIHPGPGYARFASPAHPLRKQKLNNQQQTIKLFFHLNGRAACVCPADSLDMLYFFTLPPTSRSTSFAKGLVFAPD